MNKSGIRLLKYFDYLIELLELENGVTNWNICCPCCTENIFVFLVLLIFVCNKMVVFEKFKGMFKLGFRRGIFLTQTSNGGFPSLTINIIVFR